MSDWSAGYIADIGYTYGYYSELNPLRIKLAFLNNGLVYPECGTACELGFGQGLSTNIHAAASVTQWYGTDFNPSQASFGQELSKVSGANSQLFDESFAEFTARTDLPNFDYIGLHGIWSWVSDENRALIVEFIKKRLNVGGVVYISYNTLPGWAAFAPMRHLMTEHAGIIGSEGRGIVNRVDDAIEFASGLLDTNPSFSRANPLVGDRVKKLKEQNRQYVAHEYFNKDWHPMHFSTMAQWLEPAKIQFACSAHYIDHVDSVNLSADQQEFLNNIPDAMFKQSVLDFMVNQQFRREYWVKGLRRISTVERLEALSKLRLVLIVPRTKVPLKVTGVLGEADMSPDIYDPILDILADNKPKSIGEIATLVQSKNINADQLIQAILVLAGAGHIATAQDETASAKAKKHTDRINPFLMNKARSSGEISFLASPISGGGVHVSRFQQLFLTARNQGYKTQEEWAKFAWSTLLAANEKIVKEGKVIPTAEENLSELTKQAKDFALIHLPVLKALHIA